MQVEQTIKNGRSQIVVFPWGGGKPKVVNNFHPYYYLPIEYPTPDGTRAMGEYTAVDGRTVKKIVCKMAQDVAATRGEDHYEARTPFNTRYWIDRVKAGFDEPDPIVAGIDIEAASDGIGLTNEHITNAPDAVIIIGTQIRGTQRVVQHCWHESIKTPEVFQTKKRIQYWYPSEEEMFEAWITFINEVGVDIIAGYNALWYDIPYIVSRATKIGVNIRRLSPINSVMLTKDMKGTNKATIKGIATFDYLLGYKRLQRREYTKNTLDVVLKRELGIGKYTSDELDAAHLKAHWARNPDEVLEYNYHDVARMMLLDDELGILDSHIAFHSIFGCNLSDTLTSGKMVEISMSRDMPQFIYSSADKEKGDLKGAEPKPPKVGLHEYIVFEDLTSAYPFAMISGNMSVETLVDPTKVSEEYLATCVNIGGTYFMPHSEKEGEYVKYIRRMFQNKDEWGKTRDTYKYKSKEWKKANARREAFKVGINTVYGDTGDVHNKFYNVAIANAVTRVTRGVIDFCGHEAGKLGYNWVFGHTDSIGFTTKYKNKEKLIEVGQQVRQHLNENFPLHFRQYNIPYEYAEMNIDFEKVARAGLFSGKTRYAIKLLWVDGKDMDPDDPASVELKGFDAIRSDSSPLARKLQKELITDILNFKERKNIEPYYRSELDKIKKGEYPVTCVGTPAQVKKPLHLYPDSYYRSNAVKWSNEHLGTNFIVGSKPYFVVVNKVPSAYPPTNYVAIDEDTVIPDWLDIDWKKMRTMTKKKLEFIYEAMGWRLEGLDGQKSLFDFDDQSDLSDCFV